MPFTQVSVPYSSIHPALDAQAKFGFRNKFGNRVVTENPDGKKAIAAFIASRFAKEGTSVFASDGSTTFYVCLAMALCSFEFNREFELLTNNLGVSTELEAQPYNPPPRIKITLLGGQFDYVLNATFPNDHDDIMERQIQSARLVIVSVRSLFYDTGPTSPDPMSRRVKELAFKAESDLVIPLDWTKLAAKEQVVGANVFNKKNWEQIRANDGRHITIVCDKPADNSGDDNPFELGEKLDADGFNIKSPKWRTGSDYERYCWHAYQFAAHKHISVVEVQYDYKT